MNNITHALVFSISFGVGTFVAAAAFAAPNQPPPERSAVRLEGRKLCRAITKGLRTPPKNRGEIDPMFVDFDDIGGRTYDFKDVDIDEDGVPDSVEQGCGSPSDGTCQLTVYLSDGGGYHYDAEGFRFVRFHGEYFVIVNYGSKEGSRQANRVTAAGVVRACSKI